MFIGSRRMKRTTVIGIGVAALMVAGVAFAAWTSTGSGNGSATSGTSANSAIVTATAGSGLYPGASKSLVVTVDNPNPYPVVVTRINAGTSNAVGPTGSVCIAGSVDTAVLGDGTNAITPDGGSTSDNKIAAKPATGPNFTRSYTLTVTMEADASDFCKSQTFTIPLTASLKAAA